MAIKISMHRGSMVLSMGLQRNGIEGLHFSPDVNSDFNLSDFCELLSV